MSWGTQPVVPPLPQTCSAPAHFSGGAPTHTYGAPELEATRELSTGIISKEPTIVPIIRCPDGRVILEAGDAEVAIQALKRCIAQLQITEATQDELPDNVTPIGSGE